MAVNINTQLSPTPPTPPISLTKVRRFALCTLGTTFMKPTPGQVNNVDTNKKIKNKKIMLIPIVMMRSNLFLNWSLWNTVTSPVNTVTFFRPYNYVETRLVTWHNFYNFHNFWFVLLVSHLRLSQIKEDTAEGWLKPFFITLYQQQPIGICPRFAIKLKNRANVIVKIWTMLKFEKWACSVAMYPIACFRFNASFNY